MNDTLGPDIRTTALTYSMTTPLSFDPAHYRHHFDGMDIAADQADNIIRTLHDILVLFVDLGFDVRAAPHVLGTDCPSLPYPSDRAAVDVLHCGYSDNQTNEEGQ